MPLSTKGEEMKPIGFIRSASKKDSNDSFGKFEHTLFSGKTGDGKTTCGINAMLDRTIKEGYGMLIFDEKAKEHRVVKNIAEKYGRLGDVVEIGKPHGTKFNLFSNMSEKQIDKFAKSLIERSNDPFWSDGARLMLVDLVMYLKHLKDLHAHAREVFGIPSNVMSQTEPKNGYPFTLEIGLEPLTMREFGRIVKRISNYMMLIGKARHYLIDIQKQVLHSLKGSQWLLEKEKTKQLLAEFDALVYEVEESIDAIKGSKVKNDAGEASGFNGILFMIQASISGIMKNPYCNEANSLEIAQLLGEGKIVIINTESFTNSVLSVILEKTLDSLSLRAKYPHSHPVCIIIDEANRVLGEGNDVRTDILRESRVEVVMAVQNDEQMIRKMGEVAWNSMKQNFKTQISFHGPTQTPGVFNAIDEISGNELTKNAHFFDQNELDKTELRYQSMHGYYKPYQTSSNELLVYDHLLYEMKQVLVFKNIITQECREVDYRFSVPNQEERVNSYLKSLLMLEDEEKEDDEGNMTQPSVNCA